MNMSTLSPAAAAATDLPPVDLTPRRLADDVFQSAEEAVLAEGQAEAFADVSPPTQPGSGRRGASVIHEWRASHVAARPCQSALLAAAAGALAALVLKSQLRGRIRCSRPSRSSQPMQGRRAAGRD
jgi:hypothetical protein